MKKWKQVWGILLLVVMIEGMGSQVSAQSSPFVLDWFTDGTIAVSVIALNTAGFLLEGEPQSFNGAPLDMSLINPLDRLAVRPYSQALDISGDVFQYVTFLTPALLLFAPQEEWLTIGVMYAESALLSFGLKNILKAAVSRERPFMYYDNPAQKYIDDGDYLNSFPSGHTTMSFTGAAFLSYVYSAYFPDSPYKIPVIAGSFALAATTGVLRVLSGNHFITDVLAGALIGTASGVLVPWLHSFTGRTSSSKSGAQMSVTPVGFVWTYRY